MRIISFTGCDLLTGFLLTRGALIYDYIRSGSTPKMYPPMFWKEEDDSKIIGMVVRVVKRV